ncbi:DUF6484 domain-containing protein [Caballeronia novacaledonica]|uniref:DUF6484 domain-containing protein n=1 Tax=Caballeronia novacaledonica TaxID=1544861 RepID=A0AA37MJQ2_9BURK|nr:DUF6484 domain-containing protein [Caballeronia novacaledonica]GJH29938.1 hypothetical protein CBA19CS42_35500 [Caballeronia novacaledonica]
MAKTEYPVPQFDTTTDLLYGMVCGVLLGFTDGVPLVTFPGNVSGAAVPSRTTTQLSTEDIGRSIALVFDRSDPARPVILGCIRPNAKSQTRQDERVVIEGNCEILLRCGKASILLRSDGRVELDGVNIVSRARGRNRILGGSVDLN